MRRIWLLTVLAGVFPVAAACSDEAFVGNTMPAMITTSTTSTTIYEATTTTLGEYVIQPGDSLASIAEKYRVTMDELATLNSIDDPDHIEAGERILIPPPSLTVPAATDAAGDAETTAGA